MPLTPAPAPSPFPSPMYLWPPQWNYIDFLVVLFGYISLAPGVGSISALRVVSWVRPQGTLCVCMCVCVCISACV
jgi:hypothetical protein